MQRLRSFLLVRLSVIYLRYLIGFAFVFASIVKIRGQRFTSISPDEPIGYFFEAMYQTGFYWNFLGWGQFIAGALMMTQRFATIGTMMFFPIMLNVFMITHAIDFGSGTPVITTLMLLGTMFLLAWDYKKWMILFKRDHEIKLDLTGPEDKFMNDPIWIITGIIFIGTVVLFWVGSHNMLVFIITLLTTGIMALLIKLVKDRRRKKHPKLEIAGGK